MITADEFLCRAHKIVTENLRVGAVYYNPQTNDPLPDFGSIMHHFLIYRKWPSRRPEGCCKISAKEYQYD